MDNPHDAQDSTARNITLLMIEIIQSVARIDSRAERLATVEAIIERIRSQFPELAV